MPTKARVMKMLMVAGIVALVFRTADAGNDKAGVTPGARTRTGGAALDSKSADTPDARTALEGAANALRMLRPQRLADGRAPLLDLTNTMEFWASGTPFSEYHAALSYNLPGMRVEFTNPNGNPQHAIEVVSGKYAWNESEIGAGLEPGRGVATPEMSATKLRLLQLWTMPYGVVKAGLAAGDQAKVSTEDGATVIKFPLMGQLEGITVKATLDAKNFVTKVETQGPGNLTTEAEYSDYADRGEIATDVQFPGHIVRKRGGKTVTDLTVKKADTNNPYVVFPVPNDVTKTNAQ